MIRPLLLLAIGSFLSWSCTKDFGVQTNEPPGPMTDTEYAILKAVLDSVISSKSPGPLVLADSTTVGFFSSNTDSALTKTLQYVAQHMPSLTAEAIHDFKAKNLERWYVSSPASVDARCIRQSQTKAVYPFLTVSRVGLSTDGQQALAYVGILNAPLAGFGDCYLLGRQGGRWRILDAVMLWIS